MRFRMMLAVGLTIRLAISPFLAHPFDVYSWYILGQSVVNRDVQVQSLLLPYDYSYFLFAIPASLACKAIAPVCNTFTIQIASLNPRLNPGIPWDIKLVPGLVYDFLVKLPLICSDTFIAILLYKIASRNAEWKARAVTVATMWYLNPFVIWVSSAWGMFDTLPALFCVLSFFLATKQRPLLAGVSIAIATALKYYPIVLVVPLFIIIQRSAGTRRAFRFLAGSTIGMLVLFTPLIGQVFSRFDHITLPFDTGGQTYSGLSIWTIFTLNFTIPSSSMIATSSDILVTLFLILTYIIIIRARTQGLQMVLSFLSLPISGLLLLFHFVGENYVIWLLPFAAPLAVTSSRASKLYWSLSLVALFSSVTDSLLPYYMLPASPWIGKYLVDLLSLVQQYHVANSGHIDVGLSIGKLLLSGLGIAAFSILALLDSELLALIHPNSAGTSKRSSLKNLSAE